jgi:crotonobetainyl-CoA:carnitine CoA-transferase CaiB-like acyl-CoA transferase
VNDVASALRDPQVVARKAVIELDHPEFGVIRQVASPFRIDGVTPPSSAAPFRGEHTTAVLRELCGYADAALERLARRGVFGEAFVSEGAMP